MRGSSAAVSFGVWVTCVMTITIPHRQTWQAEVLARKLTPIGAVVCLLRHQAVMATIKYAHTPLGFLTSWGLKQNPFVRFLSWKKKELIGALRLD